MNRRLLMLLLTSLIALSAFGGSANRDALLTSEGTLFTIESLPRPGSMDRTLELTVASPGDELTRTTVPATLAGSHGRPALAYDARSETLFVFWQKTLGPGAVELLFCSWKDGDWSAPTSIDSAAFRVRYNLRIAVTNKITDVAGEAPVLRDGLTVHAIWWEQRGSGELARYAMLPIEDGAVEGMVVRDLLDFLPPNQDDRDAELIPSAVMRHPAIFEAADRAGIEVVFGDWTKNTVNRIVLTPVANGGRIRVPIGHKPIRVPAPALRAATDARIETAVSEKGLAFFAEGKSAVDYVVHDGRTWTSNSIRLDESMTSSDAGSLIRRMLETQ